MGEFTSKVYGSNIIHESLVDELKEHMVALGVEAKEARVLVNKADAQPFPEGGLDISDWKTNNQVYVKPDNTVVTKADIAIGKKVEELLADLTPGIPVINEEDPKAYERYKNACDQAQGEGKDGPTFWTIDPIDGTSSYAMKDRNSDNYAVMLGLVENGKPVFGINYYPHLGTHGCGLLVYTDRGQVKWGEFEEDGLYMARPVTTGPITFGGARNETLRITPNLYNVLLRSPEIAERYCNGYETEVAFAEPPMPSSLQMLQGKAQLGAHWELAGVWDVVPYMALCNAQGISTVTLDKDKANADGSLDFTKLPENLKPGTYLEGTPDTLRTIGALNEEEYALQKPRYIEV